MFFSSSLAREEVEMSQYLAVNCHLFAASSQVFYCKAECQELPITLMRTPRQISFEMEGQVPVLSLTFLSKIGGRPSVKERVFLSGEDKEGDAM